MSHFDVFKKKINRTEFVLMFIIGVARNFKWGCSGISVLPSPSPSAFLPLFSSPMASGSEPEKFFFEVQMRVGEF
jgi:hypothetical protein